MEPYTNYERNNLSLYKVSPDDGFMESWNIIEINAKFNTIKIWANYLVDLLRRR
jgi:hypothetical protein